MPPSQRLRSQNCLDDFNVLPVTDIRLVRGSFPKLGKRGIDIKESLEACRAHRIVFSIIYPSFTFKVCAMRLGFALISPDTNRSYNPQVPTEWAADIRYRATQSWSDI